MISDGLHELFEQTYKFIDQNILTALAWGDLAEAVTARQTVFGQGSTIYASILPILACEAAGGEPKQAIPLAAAWILYDLAADVFDDVQDQDGKDWPWNRWSPTKATNVGLGLLAAGQHCLAHLSAPAVTLTDIQYLWSQVFMLAARGQAYSRQVTSFEEYFQQTVGKSGLVYAAVARAGGRLAISDEDTLRRLHDYGLALGMIIQIKDDCYDVYSSELASDLTKGIHTLPVLYALDQKQSPAYRELKFYLERQAVLTPQDIGSVCRILDEMGAFARCLGMVQSYIHKALTALSGLDSGRTGHLSEYVTQFTPA